MIGKILFPDDPVGVLDKNKVMKILLEIDYDKVFETMWEETYCRYLNPEMFAMINLRTGKLECHDIFSVNHTSPYLIFREFSIPSIDLQELLGPIFFIEYTSLDKSLEEFLKHKNIDDKKLFKNYYVNRWTSTSWYWDSIARDELDKFYSNQDFRMESVQ